MKFKAWILPFLIFPAFCLGEIEVPHILVYGTAETKATPDELIWSLTVKSLGSDIEALAAKHLDEVGAVLDYLEGEDVVHDSVKTARMQLSENWAYRNGNRLRDGYMAITEVSFTSRVMDDYVKHWTGLTKLRNLTVNGVRFDLSNRICLQDETRTKAIIAARKKAGAMAGVLGVELREPLLLEELYGGIDQSGGPNVAMMRQAEDAGGRVAPGKESIIMRVRLAYRISE